MPVRSEYDQVGCNFLGELHEPASRSADSHVGFDVLGRPRPRGRTRAEGIELCLDVGPQAREDPVADADLRGERITIERTPLVEIRLRDDRQHVHFGSFAAKSQFERM